MLTIASANETLPVALPLRIFRKTWITKQCELHDKLWIIICGSFESEVITENMCKKEIYLGKNRKQNWTTPSELQRERAI